MIKESGNFDRIEKTQETIEKIDRLMTRVDREYKKKTTEINLGGNQKEYFRLLRQFYEVYQICLVEICNELKDYQLDCIVLTLFKLFASFKVQMVESLKFCIEFTTRYEDNMKLFSLEANRLNNERMRRQERELKRVKENPNERDETIKRTTDSLTEGAEELFLLIDEFNRAKTEIDSLLNSRDQVKSMKDSGADKLLQQLLKTYKNTVLNAKFEDEEEEINRHRMDNKNDHFIDDLTKDLLKKVKGEHKKAIESYKKKANDKWKPIAERVKTEDRGFQTMMDEEEDDHPNSNDIFAAETMKRKNMQLASVMERKRLAEISQKDLMNLLDETTSKVKGHEETIRQQQRELERLKEDIKNLELKSSSRKVKNTGLKEEIGRLNAKLNQLNQQLSTKESELRTRPTILDIEKARKDIKEAQDGKNYALANQGLQFEGTMASLKSEVEELKKKIASQNSIIELLNENEGAKGKRKDSTDYASVRRSTKEVTPMISFPISNGEDIKMDSPGIRKRGSTMGNQPKKVKTTSKEKKSEPAHNSEAPKTDNLKKIDPRPSIKKRSTVKGQMSKVDEVTESPNQSSAHINLHEKAPEAPVEKKDFLKGYLEEHARSLSEPREVKEIETLIKDLVEKDIPKKLELLAGLNEMVSYFTTMGTLPRREKSPKHKGNNESDAVDKEIQVNLESKEVFHGEPESNRQKSVSSEKKRDFTNSKANSLARTGVTSPNNKESIVRTKNFGEKDSSMQYFGETTSSKKSNQSGATPAKKGNNEDADSQMFSMSDSLKSGIPLGKSKQGKALANQSGMASPVSQIAMKTFFGKVNESDEERKNDEQISKTMTDLNYVRKTGNTSTPYLKIGERDKDDEEGVKDIYNHIVKTGLDDKNNFAKIKHLMNYPFRSINDKFAEPSSESQDVELSFEYFRKFYRRLLDIHKKCGANCVHLQRFYKKIGYVRGLGGKKEFNVSKQIVDKLPKIYY